MNAKTVVLNGDRMNYDGRLDYSILSSEVKVYGESVPEQILERIQGFDIVRNQGNACSRRYHPSVPGFRKINL